MNIIAKFLIALTIYIIGKKISKRFDDKFFIGAIIGTIISNM